MHKMKTGNTQGEGRLASLDALRGLDMSFIIGLEGVILALARQFSGSEAWQNAAWHMGHAAWQGLRVYDMIFPLFVFIAGIAMGLSMQKGRKWWQQLLKLWKRALILVVLGWLVNGALSWDTATMRFASVLGLIGISCAAAGSMALAVRSTAWRAVAAAGLLLIVWSLQYFGGDMTPAGCINAWIDQRYLPGVRHHEVLDPEGVLCLVSATALTLGGMVCGSIMIQVQNVWLRLCIMAGTGLLLVVGGLCCGPIIKSIWSTGFTVSMAGWGFIIMAAMHLVIDVCGLTKWAFPLRVIGMNALFIYLATHIISFNALTARIFSGTIRCLVPEGWGGVAHATAYLLLAWGLCYLLHRRRIFIKI